MERSRGRRGGGVVERRGRGEAEERDEMWCKTEEREERRMKGRRGEGQERGKREAEEGEEEE